MTHKEIKQIEDKELQKIFIELKKLNNSQRKMKKLFKPEK